jgi:DNA-binding NarL/FixJ family response regulator
MVVAPSVAGGKPNIRRGASRLASACTIAEDLHMPQTLLIVDDNERFRAHARRSLDGVRFEVIAEADDGSSALEAVRAFRPAVVLLDVRLPDMSGPAVAERLSEEPDAPAIVLTSTYEAVDLGERINNCGARGFISKAELSGETLAAALA